LQAVTLYFVLDRDRRDVKTATFSAAMVRPIMTIEILLPLVYSPPLKARVAQRRTFELVALLSFVWPSDASLQTYSLIR
jgi:hypothetical protein